MSSYLESLVACHFMKLTKYHLSRIAIIVLTVIRFKLQSKFLVM